jgi:glucose-6-phosphate isomerase, archaeal
LKKIDYKGIVKNLRKNYDKKTIRRLKDMKNRFLNSKKVAEILKKRNPIIYTVYRKENKEDKGIMSLTVINSGRIGKEFFMTKGHKHKKKSPEEYILVKGKGILLLQKHICKAKELVKNKKVKISGKEGHRLVNIGNKNLEVITIESKKEEKDYNIKFKKSILKEENKL